MSEEQTQASDSQSGDQENETTALLSSIECRILGALMEKQLSTPDNYPLTVNSLISASNQKSNREPVTNYQKGEMIRTLRALEERRLVRYDMGARSEKYEQRFTHEYSISKKQQALLSVMMLRGPQTINELHTRTQRLHEFDNNDDLIVSLERLTQGESPMAVVIPRQSGQRDDRYAHTLCGEPQPVTPATSMRERVTRVGNDAQTQELTELKAEVQQLRAQLEQLYLLTGHEIEPEAAQSDA